MDWRKKPSLDLDLGTELRGMFSCPCGAKRSISAKPGVIICPACGRKARISPLWYLDEENGDNQF